jgi:hypothetical protein
MASGNRVFRWVLVVALAGGALCVLACGGVIYFMIDAQTDQVREILEFDPTFSNHVGKIETFTHNFFHSANHGAEADVYDVKGTKWSGRVTVKQDDDGQITWARFALPTGEVVEIRPRARLLDGDDAAMSTPGDPSK